MEAHAPAVTIPPGEFIREELAARKWSSFDLAAILGESDVYAAEMLSGQREITAENAQSLAVAFGTSPGLWLNLESAYRQSLVR